MTYKHMRVSSPTSTFLGFHAPHNVSGYRTLWNIWYNADTLEIISVHLLKANDDRPSKRAQKNYEIVMNDLH